MKPLSIFLSFISSYNNYQLLSSQQWAHSLSLTLSLHGNSRHQDVSKRICACAQGNFLREQSVCSCHPRLHGNNHETNDPLSLKTKENLFSLKDTMCIKTICLPE